MLHFVAFFWSIYAFDLQEVNAYSALFINSSLSLSYIPIHLFENCVYSHVKETNLVITITHDHQFDIQCVEVKSHLDQLLTKTNVQH